MPDLEVPDSDDLERLTFEEAMERLEEIVTKMQDDSVGLEAAFKLWEEGQRLHALCQARLDEIQATLDETEAKDEPSR